MRMNCQAASGFFTAARPLSKSPVSDHFGSMIALPDESRNPQFVPIRTRALPLQNGLASSHCAGMENLPSWSKYPHLPERSFTADNPSENGVSWASEYGMITLPVVSIQPYFRMPSSLFWIAMARPSLKMGSLGLPVRTKSPLALHRISPSLPTNSDPPSSLRRKPAAQFPK